MTAPAVAAVPTLAEIQLDIGLLERVQLDALITLRRQARHLEADLAAAIERRMVREPAPPVLGEVLGVEEAAKRLGTSPDSLYRKHRRLRLGYKDPLDGRLKFTEQELAEYVRRQRRL